MSYVILGDFFSFPDGTAATNRVYTYAKGLVENGDSVHVICFQNEFKKDNNGIREGIHYYNPFGQIQRNKYFIVRRFLELLKYFRTFRLLKKINRAEKISTIHLYTYGLTVQAFGFLCACVIRSNVTLERSEHPLRYFRNRYSEKIFGGLKIWLETKLCHGIICISNYLIDFYVKRGFSKEHILLLPSTVDPARFENIYPGKLPFEYILYCGSITSEKDGVDILIGSMSLISRKHSKINLVLIGPVEYPEIELSMRDLVNKKGLTDRVFFLGQKPRDEVPPYVCNAKILALARPGSRIAEAGFPSKVSEYLASGNPVAVTKVGEIPLFLKDKETAFLCEPDSEVAFSETLDFILGNYEFAKSVGSRGKKLADDVFNYKVQSKRLKFFFNTLNSHDNPPLF